MAAGGSLEAGDLTLDEDDLRTLKRGAAAVLGAVPVSLAGWALLISGWIPGGAIWIALATLVAAATSGLVLWGLVRLAEIHPVWTSTRVIGAYAIGGVLAWGLSAFTWGPDSMLLDLAIALMWPAGLFLVLYVNVLGMIPPNLGA